MKILHIMSGLPGSGKSTYIHQWASPLDTIVSRDEVRASIRKQHDSTEYFPVPAAEEYEIWAKACAEAIEKASPVDNIWLDQTSLNNGAVIKLLTAIGAHTDLSDCQVVIEIVHTPINVCLERNAKRTGFARVPDEVIERMSKSFDINTKDLIAVLGAGWESRVFVSRIVESEEGNYIATIS